MSSIKVYSYNNKTDSNVLILDVDALADYSLEYPQKYLMIVGEAGHAEQLEVGENCVLRNGGGVLDGVTVNGALQLFGGATENVSLGTGGLMLVTADAAVSHLETTDGSQVQMLGGTLNDAHFVAGARLEINAAEVTLEDFSIDDGAEFSIFGTPRINLRGKISGAMDFRNAHVTIDGADMSKATLELTMNSLTEGPLMDCNNVSGLSVHVNANRIGLISYGRYSVLAGNSAGVDSLVMSIGGIDFTAGKTLVLTQDFAAALGVVKSQDGIALQVNDSLEQMITFADGRAMQLHDAGVVVSLYNVTSAPTAVLAAMPGVDAVLDETAITKYTPYADADKCLQAQEDGIGDVFFLQAREVWKEKGLATQNVFCNVIRSMNGKNRFGDVVLGAADRAILMLTDTENGDAFFADDVFTAMPETKENCSRLSGMAAIYAGAGNDLVDLTCCHVDETQGEVAIYGGTGKDILWGGNAGNRLFGDAGDDEIVGGAGNDLLCGGEGNDTLIGLGGSNVYAFGRNWGHDTVHLTEGEEFRLWFDQEITLSAENIAYDREAHVATISWEDDSLVVYGLQQDTLEGLVIVGSTQTFDSWNYDELWQNGAFAAAVTTTVFI